MHTPKAVKKDVCKRTLRKRNQSIRRHIDVSSCGDSIKQTTSLIASFKGEEKQKVCSSVGTVIDAETIVAMKADLGIPWEKLRKLSRYKLIAYKK